MITDLIKRMKQAVHHFFSASNSVLLQKTGKAAGPRSSKSPWIVGMTNDLRRFLNERFDFRYNQLDGTTEYREKGVVGQPFLPVDERAINGMIVDARLKGISFFRGDVQMMILSDKVQSYNPFRLYMDELPEWDGVDRVRPLLMRVSADEMWLKGGRCWLRAMVSHWMGCERSHANVLTPVLISGVQGYGKSTFCRQLLPDALKNYYLDSLTLTAGAAPERKLVKAGLINLDEFDRIREKQQASLKNLLQMLTVPIYRGKRLGWVNEPRLASFIGTTNSRQFLTDATGSRRFLCVEVEAPISDDPIEYEQLYAQLKSEYLAGEPDFLTSEEELVLQRHNKQYYCQSPLEDVFRSCFHRPLPGEKGRWLTASEIFDFMHRFNPSALRGTTAKQLSFKLSGMGLVPKHRAYGNCYYVVPVQV